ncbi:hypothetical protein HBA54_09170 [Pelagibius litoralis]|uniref:Uncharacterized protein n=1 Tax=Pelagibius litoralis TaxID=374515 RepID=A0A967C5B1_9PROT|nr:DUF6352 family protein [Pelagibius litoralis]NIA68760.1 hypothetical protein [Pelagibius litoralis]
MHDFWQDSGYHLLQRGPRGHLTVTDDYLRAYFQRPEVRPIPESCQAERDLHAALLRNPREAVSEARLGAIADPDAIENLQLVLGFRDRLLAADSLEDCYMQMFLSPGGVTVPPLFIDQLVHAIGRSLLEGETDALRARAAETFFRKQQVTINDGAIMAADAETVEMFATSGGFGSLGRLVAEAQTPLRTVELDVVNEDNAEIYWDRASRYDTVLNLNFAGAGLDALCRVLESWVRHFLDVAVSIQPVQKISDERWVWHIGLDVEASKLLNDLYNGVEVGEGRLARLLSLFRMEFQDPSVVAPGIAGRPVYLAIAMTEGGSLRLKPQNLLVNLPLAERA